MRSCILVAVSALALAGASLGQANAGTSAGAADLRGAAGQLAEPVAQVCREVCRENVCRTRCFNDRDRDEVIRERVYRERDYDRDDRRYRRPGVERRVPGVEFEAR
jgi:hypothetical protein